MPEDVVKEAIDMESREGFGDRRHQPKFNGSMKAVVSFLAGILIAIVLPQLMDLNRGGGQNQAVREAHEKTLDDLKLRTFALEREVAKGGRWTSEKQLEYTESQTEKITALRIVDAEIVQELKDIRVILADIQKTVKEIDRRTR